MKEVLWLNKNTLEEKYLKSGSVIKGIDWVQVPDGATFATGDKDNFLFRKDGWYYEHGEWVETNVLLKHFPEYKNIKLFWVKSDIKARILSNNFTVTWEQVFGEKFTDSVYKAVKQNKTNTVKKNNFTLERLLGCEVMFENRYQSSRGYITSVDNGCFVTLNEGVIITVPNICNLTFFTEDGDELKFDEYVAMYYGEQHESN